MSLTPPRAVEGHQLADHSVDRRMVMLAIMAIVVGTGAPLARGCWSNSLRSPPISSGSVVFLLIIR